MNDEVWGSLPELKGLFEVSNLGNVRTVKSKQLRKAQLQKLGYRRISLRVDSELLGYQLHRLVALVHIPNPNDYREINHIDGDKENNNVDNLEWCTRSQNMSHAFRTGLVSNRGILNPRARLSELTVINIRHCRGELTNEKLGKIFNVPTSTVARIMTRKSWSHL